MLSFLKTFRDDQSGAVTVDWVVITAAVVGMSAISFFVIEDNSNALMNAAGGAIAAENDFLSQKHSTRERLRQNGGSLFSFEWAACAEICHKTNAHEALFRHNRGVLKSLILALLQWAFVKTRGERCDSFSD